MTSTASSTPEQVRQLFNPRSIALIGATDKSRWSWSTFGNLQLHEFAGPVYLVNPRGIPVHGQDTYARIADLPPGVDLAFVMVPTTAVLAVLNEVADHGIGSVVLLTSGFAETGDEGAELERQVADLARRRGLTVLGPNGNGFINAAAGITPYGLAIEPPLLHGPVGVVLQSGALASAVLTFAQSRNIGVSLLVSMGNESMVSMTDVMRYLIDDEQTRVIALFIEAVRRPDEFLALAREALAKGKPVVAIKVGRSQAGARVARAHTGSLVGDDAVVDAVFRQNGVIRVDSLEDLIITAGLLAGDRPAARPPLRVHHGIGRCQRDHRRPGRGRGHRDPRVRAGDGGAAAAGRPAVRRHPEPGGRHRVHPHQPGPAAQRAAGGAGRPEPGRARPGLRPAAGRAARPRARRRDVPGDQRGAAGHAQAGHRDGQHPDRHHRVRPGRRRARPATRASSAAFTTA